MRRLLLSIITAYAPILAADTTTQDGQYFCFVEHVAGIKYGDTEKNEPMFSGKMNIPEGNKKFFIKVGPIARYDTQRMGCKESVDHYVNEFLQKGVPYDETWNAKFQQRSNIGQACFASHELQLTYTGDSKYVWTYRGYDQFRYSGVLLSNWFEFYADKSFMMGFLYDSGPVIEYGHCTKIEPPK